MADKELDLKLEPKIPSVTKPGVYLFDRFNESGSDDMNGMGVNNTDNYFKFSLGSWEEINLQTRQIKIFRGDDVEKMSTLADVIDLTGKPAEPPQSFLPNTEENVIDLGEPKPPENSTDSTNRSGVMFGDEYLLFVGDYYKPPFIDGESEFNQAAWYFDRPEDPLVTSDGRTVHRWKIDLKTITKHEATNNSDNGLLIGSFRKQKEPPPGVPPVGFAQQVEVVRMRKETLPFHNDPALDNRHPEFKLTTNPKGYWKVNDIKVIEKKVDLVQTAELLIKTLWNNYIVDRDQSEGGAIDTDIFGASGGYIQADDVYFKYIWTPNLHAFKSFSREGEINVDDPNWTWTRLEPNEGMFIDGEPCGFDWRPFPSPFTPGQKIVPRNIFWGHALVSENEPFGLALNQAMSENVYIPNYHRPNTEGFAETSSPCKVWFAARLFQTHAMYYQQNPATSDVAFGPYTQAYDFNNDVFKYHVLEWGDEDKPMGESDIMKSEFFKFYDLDEGQFDRASVKRLFQVVDAAQSFLKDDKESVNYTSHVYTTPGIKKIKTVIFRMSSDQQTLLQTILINTNIVINDPEKKLQDFNIFGATNFNILPMKTSELLIGAIDDRSEYIESLKQIRKDSLFSSNEFSEKKYTDEFIPAVSDSVYGKYPGSLDIGTTRIFSKVYDIYHFLSANVNELINNNFTLPDGNDRKLPENSIITDILIDDKNCEVELNPQDQEQVIENTGKASGGGVMIGDYKLIKEENQELRKEDAMNIAKIEKSTDRQAY